MVKILIRENSYLIIDLLELLELDEEEDDDDEEEELKTN